MSKKKASKKAKIGQAVFVYTSVCCESPARKPPVVRAPEDRKENKFSECTLGHWRCTKCGKPAKVKRSKPQKEENGTTESTGTQA